MLIILGIIAVVLVFIVMGYHRQARAQTIYKESRSDFFKEKQAELWANSGDVKRRIFFIKGSK
jgi:hypothetical protein